MTKRILVTGASGFIGRAAVRSLVRRGFEVHAVARGPPTTQSDGVEWHAADLMEAPEVTRVVLESAPSHVLHLAWVTEPGRYLNDPSNLDWLVATLHLGQACAAAGVRRVVGVGSCVEYHLGAASPLSEDSPTRPTTLYGTCKLAAFTTLHAYARSRFSFAWARVFHLYGAGEHPGRLVPSVLAAVRAGHPAPLTSGEQVRDFLHVDDVGEALAHLADVEVDGAVNVGSGVARRVRDVAEAAARVAGGPHLLRFGALPNPPSDASGSSIVADPSLLRSLGWKPRHTLESGLKDTLIKTQPVTGNR